MLVNGVWEQAQPGSLSCFGGFLFIGEEADVVIGAMRPEIGLPFTASLAPINAPIGRTSAPTRYVLTVASPCSCSEIVSAIVETVPVDMVAFKAIVVSQSKNFSVQEYSRVRAARSIATAQIPTPPTGKIDISNIDQRVFANSAMSVENLNRGCQAVIVSTDDSWSLDVPTSLAAIELVSQLEPRRRPRNRLAARRTGKIYRHRDNSSVSDPGAVVVGCAGVDLRLHVTTPDQIGEVA